jgi:hypothetical protein
MNGLPTKPAAGSVTSLLHRSVAPKALLGINAATGKKKPAPALPEPEDLTYSLIPSCSSSLEASRPEI